jgi:hypothetical protein
MLGMRKDRLVLVQLPAFSGHEFVMQVKKLIAEIEQIPTSKRARIVDSRPTQDIKVHSHP